MIAFVLCSIQYAIYSEKPVGQSNIVRRNAFALPAFQFLNSIQFLQLSVDYKDNNIGTYIN
jgi:hypothetical protein